ncbi:hypothetical protein [Brevundimonas fluminis]|jgi:hypothetical protein|uniref:hypothetical protein n=1 Tax=Brevundimonas fluminis TaxID=2487274 RepID=UPI000F656505|nr:hypothetical protein [Brevundimonas fluminis]
MKGGPATFSPRVVLAVIAAAALCLGAVAVLTAYAPELSDGDDGRGHALSKSAVGYAGLVRLLRGMQRPVILLRGPPHVDQGGLLVLTPDQPARADQTDRLLNSNGSILVVLPKWQVGPALRHDGWVQRLGPLPMPLAARVLPDGLPPLAIHERAGASRVAVRSGGRTLGSTGQIDGARTVSGPGWLPVLVDDQGRALVVSNPDHGVYVTAEPDLLATHALADISGAGTAVAVLDHLRQGGPVMFDLTLAGFSRPRSVLRLLLEPPLLGFTLCLLAAALLTGWQAAVRFGPARGSARAIAPGKRTLADNTAALARLARKEHRLAPAYVEVIRRSALRRAAVPTGLAADRADAVLDRLAARAGETQTLAAYAARASNTRSAADLVTLAQSLFRWKGKITHAGR